MPIDLGPNSLLSKAAPSPNKPRYLVTLDNGTVGKSRTFEKFIALEKPESVNGFIQVKGFFCDKGEEEVVKSFAEIIVTAPKEQTLEMMFPIHRVYSIRSLVFNAVKPTVQAINVGQ